MRRSVRRGAWPRVILDQARQSITRLISRDRLRVPRLSVPARGRLRMEEGVAHLAVELDVGAVLHLLLHDLCRGAWARVTIDQFRHLALQTG